MTITLALMSSLQVFGAMELLQSNRATITQPQQINKKMNKRYTQPPPVFFEYENFLQLLQILKMRNFRLFNITQTNLF